MLSCGGGSNGAVTDPSDSDDFVQGEILVGVRAGTKGDASLEAALSAVGQIMASDSSSAEGDYYRIQLPDGVSFDQAQTQLTANANVLVVEPNYHVYGYAAPDDPDFATQYGTGTGATKVTTELAAAWGAWAAGTGITSSAPIVVAVLDTGVLATHEDLVNKVDTTNARDFVSNPAGAAGAVDDNGHGTQVAGIVAAELNNTLGIAGVAAWTSGADPQVVKVLPVKVLNSSNIGNHAAVAAGINWAVAHGAHVIVISLGSLSPSWTLQSAVQNAWTNHCLIVAAAGNNATSLMRYPAAYQSSAQNVLSVGAVDATDTLDTTTGTGSNYGSWVKLLAPGVGLHTTDYTADDAYTDVTGTSFAAAHVAGAAALLWSAYPPNATSSHVANKLTNAELRQILISSVDSYSHSTGKTILSTGGRLNVQKALANAPNAATAVPASVIFDSASPKSGSTINGTLVLTTAVSSATVYDLTASPSNAVTFATPATVTVAAGGSSGTFRLTAGAVAVSTNVTITATVHGGSAAASTVITIGPPAVSRVAFSPASVVGGSTATGTVTVDTKAPAGGLTITLACVGASCSSITLPSAPVVAAGTTSATFTVTTAAVTSSASVRITGAAPGQTTAVPASGTNLTLLPLLESVSVSSSTVKGGVTVTGTVKLSGNAPTGGALVTLTSSTPSVASVPVNVTVAAGSKSKTFSITTYAIVPPEQTITLSASYTASSHTTTVQKTFKVQPPSFVSVSCSPSSIMFGVNSTCTVTLDAVPSGTMTVNLSASDSIVAIPATLSISGAKTGTFTVTPATAMSNVSVAVTATATGYLPAGGRSGNVTVQPELTNLTVSPTSVVGGLSSTGTITLATTAPAGGVAVSVWTDQASWTVNGSAATSSSPATVTVASGSKTATFTVLTAVAAANVNGTVSVLRSGVTRTASLKTTEPALFSLSLSPSSVVGGGTVTGTVTLTAAAPAAGVVVALTSSSTSVATVLSSISVAPGSLTGTFTVTSYPVATDSSSTITASANGVSKSAIVSVTTTPLALASVSVSPTSVTGGVGTSTGTVTLNRTSSTVTTVTLSNGSSTAINTMPTSLSVPANQLSATFSITTNVVSSWTTVTITGTYGGSSRTATLTVTPGTAISSVALNPTHLAPDTGATVAGTITLTGTVPSGGIDVALTATVGGSPSTLVTFVANPVHIASGSSGTFTVNATTPVATSTAIVITATFAGTSASTTLTLDRPTLTGVSLNPTSVYGGQVSVGTVTLATPAPTGGLAVSLVSEHTNLATVPASVTVLAGAKTATFNATSLGVTSTATTVITATYNSVSVTDTLTVDPMLASVSLNPTSVYGGQVSVGTVTLATPAATGGLVVSLASQHTSVATVSANVTVLEGATTATFNVTSLGVTSTATTDITATYSGAGVTATLTVDPMLASVSLNPTSVYGGNVSVGTVTLATPAPIGNLVVSLASQHTSVATVPANVTVLSGATTATFNVTSLGVASSATTDITATYSGAGTSATLTVNPWISGITVDATPVTVGNAVTGTVTLATNAPVGGLQVTVTLTDSLSATVSQTVTVLQSTNSITYSLDSTGLATGAAAVTATDLTHSVSSPSASVAVTLQ